MISGHLSPLQTYLWILQLPTLQFLGPVKSSHPYELMAVKTLNQAIFVHFVALTFSAKGFT